MLPNKLLVANRGEIAVRIIRAATDLGVGTVAVHPPDDEASLHVSAADNAIALPGRGAAGYLDIDAVIAAATDAGCDAVHPGYGFLAENPELARRCEAVGLDFIGPRPADLELFGDKGAARAAAIAADVPVAAGTQKAVTVDEARAFLADLGPGGAMMIKALGGGGGRGTRAVNDPDQIEATFDRCRSEAQAAFGNGELYVEQLVLNARHIEVQIAGDDDGTVVHFGDRECSMQRRYQKIMEIAPAPALNDDLRTMLHGAAVRLASSVGYRNLGTIEFLVGAPSGPGQEPTVAFIEANARLQVEHTVTEEVTGLDLVQLQLHLAAGTNLAELGLTDPATVRPRGYAIQARINTELMGADGSVRPSGGMLSSYDAPGGPGVRTDGFGYAGYRTNPAYDSLLAKVIAHAPSPDPAQAAARLRRALTEFRIGGVTTNLDFLWAVAARPELIDGHATTDFIEDNAAELIEAATNHRTRFATTNGNGAAPTIETDENPASGRGRPAVDANDPLALFAHDDAVKAATPGEGPGPAPELTGPDGALSVVAPMQGTIVAVNVTAGDEVVTGMPLVVMEAMKMEHVIAAEHTGVIQEVTIEVGEVIYEGYPLVFITEADVSIEGQAEAEALDPDHIRDDLAEMYRRKAFTLDENRPDATARRRKTNQRTARENIEDLIDDGSFIEYGPLVLAAQRARRTEEWLQERTPADGLVAGVGSVNGELFDDEHARCIAISYDYTVFAGTQGHRNHYKQDRMFELANHHQLPIMFFTEGGGGRPGDTDGGGGIGMDVYTFTQFSKLSGLVPLVGLNSGRCFAGNTALLACCDVIIATKDSTIAMGGPAMIEGGGLGVYTPEEVGPMSFQVPNGVVDIIVDDDEALVEVGKKYLSYFQGPLDDWEANDQRLMRHIVPENRVRMYDVREVIDTLADVDSVLEIRREFGVGIITALIRVEGVPMGVIANNPHHLAGAIDSDGADKGARFLQLCDAFDLPVISIMDCPGIMVGPDAEREALVRKCARMFVTGANLQVPMFGLIIRKAYGLGVQAMCGGSSMVPFFSAAWPTAEFAGMNIEGAVKLGYRNDLADLETAEERKALFDEMVEKSYERARAVNGATFFGVDDVIDPADSRHWVVRGLKSLPPTPPRTGKRRPYIDTW